MASSIAESRLFKWLEQVSDDEYDAAHSRYSSEPYHRRRSWRKFLKECVDLQEQDMETRLESDRSATGQEFYNAYWNLDARVTAFFREQEREAMRRNAENDAPPPYTSSTTLNHTYGNPIAYGPPSPDNDTERLRPQRTSQDTASNQDSPPSRNHHGFHRFFHRSRDNLHNGHLHRNSGTDNDRARSLTDRRQGRISGLFDRFVGASGEDSEGDERPARTHQPNNTSSARTPRRYSRTGFAIGYTAYSYNRRYP